MDPGKNHRVSRALFTPRMADPNLCPCGRKKAPRFDLCKRCERFREIGLGMKQERERGIEFRDQLLGTNKALPNDCDFCGEVGTEENPLGLYGPNAFRGAGANSHYSCWAERIMDRRGA